MDARTHRRTGRKKNERRRGREREKEGQRNIKEPTGIDDGSKWRDGGCEDRDSVVRESSLFAATESAAAATPFVSVPTTGEGDKTMTLLREL